MSVRACFDPLSRPAKVSMATVVRHAVADAVAGCTLHEVSLGEELEFHVLSKFSDGLLLMRAGIAMEFRWMGIRM